MARSHNRLLTAVLALLLLLPSAFATACTPHPTDRVVKYDKASNSQPHGQVLKEILDTTPACEPLRVLRFEGQSGNATAIDETLRALTTPLEDIHWSVREPIPRSTLQTLEQFHPSARLHYEMPFGHYVSTDDVVEGGKLVSWKDLFKRNSNQRMSSLRSIVSAANLYSLDATLYDRNLETPDDLPLVHEVLTTSTNLRELDLNIANVMTCTPAFNPRAFDFVKNPAPMAALEVLKIKGRYDIEATTRGEMKREDWKVPKSQYFYKPWSWLPDALLDSIRWRFGDSALMNTTAYDEALHLEWAENARLIELRGPENLVAWMSKMDWSKLRVLHLVEAERKVLEQLGPVLSNIEELNLGYGSAPAAEVLPTFVRNLTGPLTKLCVRNYDFKNNYTEFIQALSESSGPHLQSLCLTEHSEYRHQYCSGSDDAQKSMPHHCPIYYTDRPYLTTSDIHLLAQNATNLTSLNFDLRRLTTNISDLTTWTIDESTLYLAASPSFPHLQNLTLHLDSPEMTYKRAGIWFDRQGYMNRPSNMKVPTEPTLNRTYVSDLFNKINSLRTETGLETLGQLEIIVGRWNQRDTEFGMMGAPNELVGKWVCDSKDHMRSVSAMGECYGGNAPLESIYGRTVGKEPYSNDWSQPDKPDLEYEDDYGMLELDDLNDIAEW